MKGLSDPNPSSLRLISTYISRRFFKISVKTVLSLSRQHNERDYTPNNKQRNENAQQLLEERCIFSVD